MSVTLLIRPGAIGDTIVWLPAAGHWAAAGAEIWVPTPNLPLVRHLGPARAISSSGLDLLGLDGVEPPPALLSTLGSFQTILSWYGGNRPEFRQHIRSLGLPFRFYPALPPQGCDIHAADFYLAQAGLPAGAAPRLPFERCDEGFAVIHPFSGSSSKNWPVVNFRTVADAIEFAGVPVHWTAGPEETLPEARRFDDLGALARWLARARVFIGNDSGIAHLAAACGVPVVAMFGPSDPRVWAPRGDRVRVFPFEAAPSAVAAAALDASSLLGREPDR